MKIVEYKTITCSFTFLELGGLFRRSLGGDIYLKILPISDKHGVIWNCVNLVANQIGFTFENTDVFPVNGTFVEGYKEG